MNWKPVKLFLHLLLLFQVSFSFFFLCFSFFHFFFQVKDIVAMSFHLDLPMLDNGWFALLYLDGIKIEK